MQWNVTGAGYSEEKYYTLNKYYTLIEGWKKGIDEGICGEPAATHCPWSLIALKSDMNPKMSDMYTDRITEKLIGGFISGS